MQIFAKVVVTALILLSASPAFGFCGFYVGGADAQLFNDATQVVLLRDGETTVLSMQNNYEGPAQDFAMVVPVPQVLQKENVKTLNKALFDKIDRLSAPRLVEYWEQDPCAPQVDYKARPRKMTKGKSKVAKREKKGGEPLVKIEAQFEVAEYDIVILSAKDASALEAWLAQNKYNIPEGAAPYFEPYVEGGSYFFVAKVNLKRAKYKDGSAVLSPLRFHYTDKALSIPVRLGLINSKGQQDLIAYVLSDNQRYEVANYPNVTIPTNVEVNPKTKENFGGFYEALFSRVTEENEKAVVTEYSWPAVGCDPCPAGSNSALTQSDIATLGADVLDGAAPEDGLDKQGKRVLPPKMRKKIKPRKVRVRPSYKNWILTRLHARYTKEGLGEDLVLKKAEPIIGGRQHGPEQGSEPSHSNNFQGRYIIRYEWTGEVACENPQRGIWGGPWKGGTNAPTTAASRNTAGAAKKVEGLASLLAKPIQGLAIPSAHAQEKPKDETPVEVKPPTEKEVADTTAPNPTKAEEKPSGCASISNTTHGNPFALVWLALGLISLRVRRASRKS